MDRESFTRSVVDWYDAGHRKLPWRETRDPYRIWISEIMLQQTRAETVVSYYERFLARYPTVQALALSDEQELLKCWEGLGYYSRARSLRLAALEIVKANGGELPADVQKLRALPGIGDYTAGAIASIAFGIPAAAVDGNVERVLCRYDAVQEEVGTPAVRRRIAARAQELVPADRPGAFANAMMELGATVCTSRNPACLMCPVRDGCRGLAQGLAAELPRKARKKPQRVERRAVLLVLAEGRVLVVQRREKLLGGLYVFPDVLLGDGPADPSALCAQMDALGLETAYDGALGSARHVFTHIIWEMEIFALAARRCGPVDGGRWVTAQELSGLPLPTAVKAARAHAMRRLKGGA